MSVDELYQELLLDHSKNPRHKGRLSPADCSCALNNPLCGDKVDLTIRQGADGLELLFEGVGCSISQASASLMTEVCHGATLERAKYLSELFHRMMRSELSEAEQDQLKDAAILSGVRKFSTRIRCALLAWDALDKCLGSSAGLKP